MTTRVLQVVGGLGAGGVETWLMQVLRNIDRNAYRFDFLVHASYDGHYAGDAMALGARLLECSCPQNPIGYARTLNKIIEENGPYDVVHGHLQLFNGVVMAIASRRKVPIRIAHSHLAWPQVTSMSKPHRWLYGYAMRSMIERHATLGLAASAAAGDDLFPKGWTRRIDRRVLYCGVEVPQARDSRVAIRSELGIDNDALVVCHVGRFVEQKNHPLVVAIFESIVCARPDAVLLLVGDGPSRHQIVEQVAARGLSERVKFLGLRRDVPRLLKASSVLLLPSRAEGLPVVALEAQASALPCVLSDAITRETEVVPGAVRYVTASAPPSTWAREVLAQAGGALPRDCAALVRDSRFGIAASVRELENAYSHAPCSSRERYVH